MSEGWVQTVFATDLTATDEYDRLPSYVCHRERGPNLEAYSVSVWPV